MSSIESDQLLDHGSNLGSEVVGVKSVCTDKGPDKAYDLQGRIMNQANGLFIKNGQKVIR